MLLVDDAQENIQVVNSILKDIYKIRIATNGPKALELAKADPLPALVLLDVMMPEMDGYECASLPAVTWHRGSSGPICQRYRETLRWLPDSIACGWQNRSGPVGFENQSQSRDELLFAAPQESSPHV